VLVWGFAPGVDAGLPLASYAPRVLVVCQVGYTWRLAAAALRSLGVDATDVVGGFRAWREARLPVARDAQEPAPGG
jgi:rhodanese-related sulfurtransferase